MSKPAETRADITRCRSCGAEIFFARTKNGRTVPLNRKSEKRFVLIADEACLVDVFTTHFSDCPNSASHRRPRTKE